MNPCGGIHSLHSTHPVLVTESCPTVNHLEAILDPAVLLCYSRTSVGDGIEPRPNQGTARGGGTPCSLFRYGDILK